MRLIKVYFKDVFKAVLINANWEEGTNKVKQREKEVVVSGEISATFYWSRGVFGAGDVVPYDSAFYHLWVVRINLKINTNEK